MNNRINPDVDIIKDVLKAVLEAQPASVFVNSLLQQYQERGGLSKKQLEGLHSKALKINTINPGKLATLEAIIKKKPTRYKSDMPVISNAVVKDNTMGEMMDAILTKYPQHKRVLFLKMKYENNEPLTNADITEIQKFKKLLL